MSDRRSGAGRDCESASKNFRMSRDKRIVIWRDAELQAEHARAPDGAHRRVVDPAHFAPLFGR